MDFGIKLAADETRYEAAEGSADLVRASWKVFADEPDNARLDPGNFRGDFQAIDTPVQTGVDVIFPGDPEEVDRIDIPKADALEPGGDGWRNEGRVPELLERGNKQPTFPATFGSFPNDLRVEALDDPGHEFFSKGYRAAPAASFFMSPGESFTRDRKIMAAIMNGL